VSGGAGWFIVDEVLGKHEYITYALGLSVSGAVKQIEILDYRETYGYEVREASWREQFVGKTTQNSLKLDGDIRNISGATLSSRHITEGVRRLLATYEVALR
jgi:Na+-translocating ferredoxin:NAD+ oxidoreductase RnfG subunit